MQTIYGIVQLRSNIQLVYGAEAVLPPDIRLKSPRVLMFFEEEEPKHRDLNLMLLEEERDRAAYRVQRYQQSLRKYHNQRVRIEL